MFAIGIPVMMSELVIGRRSQRNPVGAFRVLSPGRPWYLVGMMGIISAFMILAFYTAVAGWTLEYIYQTSPVDSAARAPRNLLQCLIPSAVSRFVRPSGSLSL
jgi:NSS family neurotransmitter:Na+ symporter